MRMNQSVDRSIILPDQHKHFIAKDQAKIKKIRIVTIVLAIVAIVVVGISFALIASSQSISKLQDQKNSLQAQNNRLVDKNINLQQKSQEKATLNTQLTEKQITLSNQLNKNNDIIQNLQQYIRQNCNDTYQKLRFNETNLNKLTISVYGASNNRPVIAYLNLSNNNLSTFTDNVMPDLQTIDLSNNPITKISNNQLYKSSLLTINSVSTLQQFSSNILPNIVNLDLSGNKISSFNNNTMTLLQTLNLDRNNITNFSYYSLNNLKYLSLLSNNIQQIKGNILPNLEQFILYKDNIITPNSIINNFFGKITTLTLNNGGNTFKFSDNYFPELSQLTILNSKVQNYAAIRTNRMPLLSKLKMLNIILPNYQYLQQFRLLKSIQFQVEGLQAFSGQNYPNLQVLYLNETRNLLSFEKNIFPSLTNLTLTGAPSITTICNNYGLSKLTSVSLVYNFAISEISCIMANKILVELILDGHQINKFQDYDLPLLQKLVLKKGPLESFVNNKFPRISNFTYQGDLKAFSFNQLGLLEKLQILKPIQSFTNNKFQSLQTLTINNGKVSLDLTNNVFDKLYKLQILYVKSLTFTNNKFNRWYILDIRYVQSQIQFNSNIKDASYLSIFNSKVSNFTNQKCYYGTLDLQNVGLKLYENNTLSQVTIINLSYNQLTTFDCSGMPLIDFLSVNNNQLKADIIDRIIGCNLMKLRSLNLQYNQIQQNEKNELAFRLKQKYPDLNAYL